MLTLETEVDDSSDCSDSVELGCYSLDSLDSLLLEEVAAFSVGSAGGGFGFSSGADGAVSSSFAVVCNSLAFLYIYCL